MTSTPSFPALQAVGSNYNLSFFISPFNIHEYLDHRMGTGPYSVSNEEDTTTVPKWLHLPRGHEVKVEELFRHAHGNGNAGTIGDKCESALPPLDAAALRWLSLPSDGFDYVRLGTQRVRADIQIEAQFTLGHFQSVLEGMHEEVERALDATQGTSLGAAALSESYLRKIQEWAAAKEGFRLSLGGPNRPRRRD